MDQYAYVFTLILYFAVSSFAGWLLEVVFRSFMEKRFVNPGFLFGPFVPIYGAAVTAILLFDQYWGHLPFYLKCVAFSLIPTLFEYIASYVMEKALAVKLWDYSHFKLHFQGRICLSFSLAWAALVIFVNLFYQPIVLELIRRLSFPQLSLLASFFAVYFGVDFITSVKAFTKIASLMTLIDKLEISELTSNISAIKIKSLGLMVRPLRAFPNVSRVLQKRFSSRLSEIWTEKTDKTLNILGDAEFSHYVQDIIEHPVFQELDKIQHHYGSIYAHSLKVSYLSFRLGKFLSSRFTVDLQGLARGALLHDFFLYDWRHGSPTPGKWHAFEHPKDALKNSTQYFPNITPVEKDIILKHMWPLWLHPPKYVETLIVVVVDKLVASNELVLDPIRSRNRKPLRDIDSEN